MAEGYNREWKFRAWDNVEKKLYSPEELEEPDTDEEAPKTIFGKLINGELIILNEAENPPRELYPMQSTNIFDNEQNEVYEGDIIEMDDKHWQVVWNSETSGYNIILLDGEEFYYQPIADYISDAVKVVGNVFENGDGDPDEMKRTLKFRAWDPAEKRMYLPEDIKDPEEDFMSSIYAYLSFGALYIYDIKNDPPMELIPMQFTEWLDRDGVEIYENDLITIGEEDSTAMVEWSEEVGQFIFVTLDGTIYPGSNVTASQVKVIGNSFQDPEKFPQTL